MKGGKYSMDKDFEAFIYCDKGIYKSIQKAHEGFLIKKNPTIFQKILQTAKSIL